MKLNKLFLLLWKRRKGDSQMRKLLLTFFIISLISFQLIASPSFRIGNKIITNNNSFNITYFDTTGKEMFRVTYDDSYWGWGIEAEYGPLLIFCLRVDLAELRLFKAGGGSFVIFPALGGDIICEPPFDWRVLPYIYGGYQLTTYWGNQGTLDTRFIFGPEYHVRFGIGTRYSLNQRIDLFGEVQLFNEDTYTEINPEYIGEHWIVGSIAVNKIQIGARLALSR